MILVDSNVLIDIATSDPVWSEWSGKAVAAAGDQGALAINPIIFAELSIGYDAIEAFTGALDLMGMERLDLPYEAGFLAGKAFREYRRRGGARTSPLPDFYIGAHALVSSLAILTRDPRRFATYFPAVQLIAP